MILKEVFIITALGQQRRKTIQARVRQQVPQEELLFFFFFFFVFFFKEDKTDRIPDIFQHERTVRQYDLQGTTKFLKENKIIKIHYMSQLSVRFNYQEDVVWEVAFVHWRVGVVKGS